MIKNYVALCLIFSTFFIRASEGDLRASQEVPQEVAAPETPAPSRWQRWYQGGANLYAAGQNLVGAAIGSLSPISTRDFDITDNPQQARAVSASSDSDDEIAESTFPEGNSQENSLLPHPADQNVIPALPSLSRPDGATLVDMDKVFFAFNAPEHLFDWGVRNYRNKVANYNVDTVYVPHSPQSTQVCQVGQLIDLILRPEVKGLKNAPLSKIHARMIAALAYQSRTDQSEPHTPWHIASQLIDDTITQKAPIHDLKRFFSLGCYGLDLPYANEAGKTVRQYLTKKSEDPLVAEEVRSGLSQMLSSEPATWIAQTGGSLFEAGSAYYSSKGYQDGFQFQLMTDPEGATQSIPPSAPAAASSASTTGAARSMNQDFNHAPQPTIHQIDEIVAAIRSALDAQNEDDFTSAFGKVRLLNSPKRRNIDVLPAGQSGTVGAMIDTEAAQGSVNAYILQALFYARRSAQGTSPRPEYTYMRLIKRALENIDFLSDLEKYMRHAPIDLDVDKIRTAEGAILGTELNKRLTPNGVALSDFRLLVAVQNTRSKNESVIKLLLKYAHKAPLLYHRLLIDWIRRFDIPLSTIAKYPFGKNVRLETAPVSAQGNLSTGSSLGESPLSDMPALPGGLGLQSIGPVPAPASTESGSSQPKMKKEESSFLTPRKLIIAGGVLVGLYYAYTKLAHKHERKEEFVAPAIPQAI